MVAGHEVLAVGDVRDRLAEGLVLLLQQPARRDRFAIVRPAVLYFLPGLRDLGRRAVPAVGQATQGRLAAQFITAAFQVAAVGRRAVEPVQRATTRDPRLRRDDQSPNDPRQVQPWIADLQDAPGLGAVWRTLGRAAYPGLAARLAPRQLTPRVEGCLRPATVAAQPPAQAVGRVTPQVQIGMLSVQPAVRARSVRQKVPGHLGQAALRVGDDPIDLLQPTARPAATPRRAGVVRLSAPGQPVQQPAARAARPAGKGQGRQAGAVGDAGLDLVGLRRLAQRLIDAQRLPQQVHIAQFLAGWLASGVGPVADVLDHVEPMVGAHQRADAAPADQVGPAGGDQPFHRIFTRAVFSTLRMLCRVRQRPGTLSSWLYRSRRSRRSPSLPE